MLAIAGDIASEGLGAVKQFSLLASIDSRIAVHIASRITRIICGETLHRANKLLARFGKSKAKTHKGFIGISIITLARASA